MTTNTLHVYSEGLDKEWSNEIYTPQISHDGNWTAFIEAFPVKDNVLHLKHMVKKTGLELPPGNIFLFSKDSEWFGSMDKDNEFVLINLANLQREYFKEVETFNFSYDGKYLAILQKEEGNDPILTIRNMLTKEDQIFNGITKFTWNPQNHSLLAIKKEQSNVAILFDASKKSLKRFKENLLGDIPYLKWNDTGTAAIIMEAQGNKHLLKVYNINDGITILEDYLLEQQIPDYEVSDREPFLSDDGKTVLFYRRKKEHQLTPKEKIEIWKTTDPELYPNMKLQKEYVYSFLLTVWYPEKGIIKEIATERYPTASMDINHNFAVVYNELQYGPQNTEFPKADLYKKEILSGKMELIVETQLLDGMTSISPTGKYISYFKDKAWWVYNLQEKKATNVTHGLDAIFQNIDLEYPEDRMEAIAQAAWTENDSILILSDRFDIWAMLPTGVDAKRLTKGRETNNHFKIPPLKDFENNYHVTVGRLSGRKLEFAKKQLLNVINYDSHHTGISVLNSDFSIEPLLYDDTSIFEVYMAPNDETVIYISQSTFIPPALFKYDLVSAKNNLIYQTNEDLLKYDLGKKSLITYIVKGKELKGALMYPANFDPKKRYPMVVNIYETTSRNAMGFLPPNGFNQKGFSITSYTTSGYFVFYPDISYEISKPGLSALECVNAAVDKVLENKNIDPEKIGLNGHSFGGYETAFIATQSDRFATYVAGAAVTNFTSHYHGVNWNNLSTDLWRYEDQQWRMGLSYYENKDAYLANSPLEFVENVTKPILLWTGDKDYQITWTQSLEMFLALKRLDKEASLILIKDEGHAPLEGDKQLLLSMEIKKWFDKYCKQKTNGT
ncbi:MAG: prolyl oligopeptidase family serine peptidase [Aequorivita sp.]